MSREGSRVSVWRLVSSVILIKSALGFLSFSVVALV